MAAEQQISKKKKLKIDQDDYIDPIFMSFLHDEKEKYEFERECLERALSYLTSGTNDMNFGILEIIDANPRTAVDFSYATFNTKVYGLNVKLKTPPGFLLGDIFVDGIDILKNYVNSCALQPRIPKNNLKRQALAKLLDFLLTQNLDVLFEDYDSEGKRAVIVAQHLLSKLSVNESYVVDASYNSPIEDERVCPCKERDILDGRKGDTSYGYDKGWHGKTSIIINDLPVLVVNEKKQVDISDDLTSLKKETEDDLSEDCSLSSGEVNCSLSTNEDKEKVNFTTRVLHQLMSKTIVFSFLQHKLHRLDNYLIPGIGIGTKDFIVYFYDCVNDLFISSKPVQLFCGEEISIPGVLLLWLTINYRLFCSGIADGMKPFKAKFFNRVGDFLEGYMNDVMKPLHMPVEKLEESDFGWSVNPGIHFEVREPDVEYIDVTIDLEDVKR